MRRERWQKITDTFDAALEIVPEERPDYLAGACVGDQELLKEVTRLLAELEMAGEFLEQPLITRAESVNQGDLLADRYRVERLLGRGGMGEVYGALDELTEEHVALKVLRAEMMATAGTVRRFYREARLARRVTHTNVCRVFEAGVHRRGDSLLHFFTMELLEGETLAARIREQGRMTLSEALPLIAQMAEGLQAAHSAGVIHLDFKSSNVMLCEGRAAITDFGLAWVQPGTKGPEAPGTVSAAAQVAGTVAYMSPEQLSGGAVTASSDIYSFGVVLFEMATGKLPFEDRHIIQSAMQRADSAPHARTAAPDVDRRWAAVIARCLQRDPKKRFAKASDIPLELGLPAWRANLKKVDRRVLLTGGLATATAVAAVSRFPSLSRFLSQDGRVPPGTEAMLSPISNLTGENRFDGITELFRNQLAQSTHFNFADSSKMAEVLRQMGKPVDAVDPETLREAAWRANAGFSIFGSVSKTGPDYVLNVQMEARGSQPSSPRNKFHQSFSAAEPVALMRSVRDAAIWVRQVVGESAASIESFDRLPSDATTPSWEALRYYAQGQRFFMKQDLDSAILEFESALREDPRFTLAALRRADLLVSQNRHREGFAQWLAAIRMLAERPVTRAEELNARGMFAFDSGDFDGADRHFRTWAVEYPGDWRGPFFRAPALMLMGHARQALDLLKPLRDRMPEYGDIYEKMISCHILLNEPAEARALIPELRKRGRPERADLREGYVRFREGDCVGYLQVLRTIRISTSYRRSAADTMLREGFLLIDAGYPEAAADNISRYLSAGSWSELAADEANLTITRAWAALLAGRRREAVAAAQRALESETSAILLALAGTIFTRAGAVSLADKALAAFNGLLELPVYEMAHHRLRGERAQASGRLEEALSEMRQAARLEPAIAHRQYLLDLLPESSPERQELCVNAMRYPWQLLRPPPLHYIGSLRLAAPGAKNSGGPEGAFARRFLETAAQLASHL